MEGYIDFALASISLNALAAFAELSRYRFLRDGRSPPETADGSGFSSQSHFTRMFHRMLGTTPGAYRK